MENDPEYRQRMYMKAQEYRRNNPLKCRAHAMNRRALLQAAEGEITEQHIIVIKKLQNGKCLWCDKPYGEDYHVDHIYCLSKGGTNLPENICITCENCNLRKHARDPLVFLKLLYRNKLDLK